MDAYGEDGKPVYIPTWEMMGYNEAQVEHLTSLDLSNWKDK